jgi:hypothetical protein
VSLVEDAAQLLYTYARAVDEGDLATLERIAHEDVSLTRVNGTQHGRAAFLDLYRGFKAVNLGSKHVVSNVQAVLENGDEEGGTVRAVAYFCSTHFDAEGTRLVYGQYSDSMRDDGDGLRFTHKRIAVERVVQLGAASAEWTGVRPKEATA